MSPQPCPPLLDPHRPHREGTDQARRMLAALRPESAPVDGRSLADDLVFVREFTRHLRYYDVHNHYPEGANWQPFYAENPTVLLALGATQSPDAFRRVLVEILAELKQNDLTDAPRKILLSRLFGYLAHWAKQVDTFSRRLPLTHPSRLALQNRLVRLAPYYKRLIAYYRAAQDLALLDESAAAPTEVLWGEKVGKASDYLSQSTLTAEWATDVELDEVPPYGPAPHRAVPWLGNVAPDASLYGTGTPAEQIQRAAGHNFLTELIYQFIQAFAQVVADCQLQLRQALTQSNHPPHLTLLLAFLRLFQYSRDHLNEITGRHLDLYYRGILQLSERPPEPNRVHVIFELTRLAEGELVKKGTLLKAGKDARGRQVHYALDEDVVVNQAQVTDLYCLYRGTPTDDALKESTDATVYANRLFASTLQPTADTPVPPFAPKKYLKGRLTGVAMPPAELGLAVASHYLYLREGSRTLTLRFTTTAPGTLPLNPQLHVEALLTTAKGWHVQPLSQATWSGTELTFSLELDEKVPAIVPYNTKVHGGSYDSPHPILYLRLKHVPGEAFVYESLFRTAIQALTLDVKVLGLRDLYLQNDYGTLDASKPFLPFGAMPRGGDGFIIGSREVFQKQAIITPRWTWKAASTTPSYQVLEQGKWKDAAVNAGKITLTEAQSTPAQAGPNVPFDVHQTQGYLRSQYGGSFMTSYNTYLKNLTTQLTQAPPATPPSPPLPPTAAALTLDYEARTTLAFTSNSSVPESTSSRFYLVYPWGVLSPTGGQVPLVPTFRHSNDTDPYFRLTNAEASVWDAVAGDDEAIFAGEVEHEAECYLGIEGMVVPGILHVLFQVEEGTADPQTYKPERHLHWSYLSAQGWVPFAQEAVVDRSRQLTRSGVVAFRLPAPATTQSSLMPAGKYWLRATVTKGSEAVGKLVGVHAQAGSATLVEAETHPDFLEKPLPAGTVAKLEQAQSAIKQVEQPYESVGGRGAEVPAHFYTRVSERLRHKDRAVTVYDYERLVLEAFPGIHKVKCLNHTRYENGSNGPVYSELAAGHVTVVTVPNLRQSNLRNPLEPYTPVDLLEEIQLFLIQRTSPFVKLHVRNPLFEPVKVVCRVAFYPGFDASFYRTLLQREITQFLSPWAFAAERELVFGGRVEKSVLINFMEERPYVDYLTDVLLLHRQDGLDESVETAVATRGISVLVSATEHDIELINESVQPEVGASCGCG
ncbi:hypothetical protein GCM10027275_02950 [Rhabdobacter roseus]|uniref:Baseplate protein J-like domain-containing protein n=1 Tax=Rhabdobacter roseus TaxID=1655419 RepID=A0A840TLS1_9BACT|nr:baseplate J/gp47 family protein [Rhabdobacter roseus]MBB5282183.1 hypothetical protein [Rhabdobacter roseus]